MQMIEISNIRKRLGSREILKGINLSVEKGEIVAIVGHSGSGKSTLLRCINRLIEVDGGDIKVNGVSVRKYNPVELRKIVGLVFQTPVMFEGNVGENISYGLRISKNKDLAYETEEVERIAREVGVQEFLSSDANSLSGGEQQRVALARALILKPKVMLLDEPTSFLDPKSGGVIENLILKLVKSRALTVIWVTHDVSQAKRVGNRIAVMQKGRIIVTDKSERIEWGKVYV